MHEIVESVTVPGGPDALWSRVGAFGAVGDWHPLIAEVRSEGDTPGSRRFVIGEDGSRGVERLLEYDVAGRSYDYAMEETALPVANYIARFAVDPDPRGARVTWSARFRVSEGDTDEGVETIRASLSAGVEALRDGAA